MTLAKLDALFANSTDVVELEPKILPALAKIIIVMWSLRGTKPADRPKILTANAKLFPVASRARRQGRELDQ